MRDWILGWGRGRAREQLGQLVNLAGIAIAAGWLLALLVPHLRVITQPGPVEYNEPAIWQCTYLLDHGRNPYTAQELPGAAYCFDPLYNYLMLALKPVIGIDYTAHRFVNLLLLLGTLGLLVRAMRRAGAGLGIALLSVVAFYWMCLYNIMITARPDLLGLFFFLLGILGPWENGYSRRSTILGLVCALVAFHCKLYFILAGCATLLGHFLVRDKREACWLGVGFFAAAGLSFALWCHFFPYYYIETVVVQRGGAALNSSNEVSAEHTVMLFNRGWPFLLLMVYGVGAWLWRRQVARRAGRAAGGSDDRRFLALGAVFLIFLVLVYFYMGRNAGAYFTYHLHLLFPLMLVLAAYAITGPWVRIGYGLLLAGFVMFRLTVPVVPDADAAYRRLEKLIYTCKGEVLGIASVTDIFERQGRRVLHNGNTMFIGFAFADDGINRDPMISVLGDHYNATIAEVERKVAAHEYAMVLTEFDAPYFCKEELLKMHYDKVEQVDYFTYFGHSPVRVWRPKPKADER
jgi:hypothetical protein